MKFKIVAFLCLLVGVQGLRLVNQYDDSLALDVTISADSVLITVTLAEVVKISGEIAIGRTLDPPADCDGWSKCTFVIDDVVLTISDVDNGFSFVWQSNNTEATFQDCLDLNGSNVNWYGGPEKWQASYPIQDVEFKNRVYTTIKSDNGAVGERYWLNSLGGYIFVEDKVPLYLDQNNIKPGSICFIGAVSGPYVGRDEVTLNYTLVARDDPRAAHLHAVNTYLGKPKAHPDEWIIRNPIWTTWAKYKKDINDKIVVDFATDIANHNFTGQIEIDDYWETCYGSLVFNDAQFANINETVKSLKDLGFTVTLWTHPFVNDDCEEPRKYGQENDFFIKSRIDGSDETNWWDGNPAHIVDFSKEGAQKWFTDRLKLLQEKHGINAFKFDAGESDYGPQNPVLIGDIEESPNLLTSTYVRTCANFGGLIEVRSAWRTQDLGIFLRMLDRDSRWGLDNGLHSLITGLLQFNLNGYVFALPDMIGGNGYGDQPTAELIARWTQANTFMPSMQFSFLPWEFESDFDGVEIIKKYVALHAEYSDEILAAMNNSIATGVPVNPPIWWVDPTNPDALKANDQYLLGEKILVAPVVEQGATSRNIVIPDGLWEDGNDGHVYEGPQIIKDYPAPIDVLPYFIKQ